MKTELLTLALLGALGMGGCATVDEAHRHFQDTSQKMPKLEQPKPAVVVSDNAGAWLLGTVAHVSKPLPAVFGHQVTLISRGMDLQDMVANLSAQAGVPMRVENDASLGGYPSATPTPPAASLGAPIGLTLPPPSSLAAASQSGQGGFLRMNYVGSLRGALDSIAAKSGMWWRYDDGTVVLFRNETRVFEIPAIAWSATETGGVGTAGANGGSSSTSGSAAAMPVAAGSGAGGVAGSQNGVTSASGVSKVDIWQSIENGAKVAAGSAKVSVDAALGTVTVTGTPPDVHRVSEFVNSITRSLRQQVALTVHVYSVEVNHEDNYGVSLNGAFSNLAKEYGLTLTGGGPSVTGLTSPMQFGASVLGTATGALSQWSGSSIAFQALSSIGHVSLVTSASAVTLNGQQVPIQVGKQIGYLASSSVTQTANVGAMSMLTPGTVTVGFTAVMLPRVVGDKVYLGVNMTVNSLLGISTVTSNGSSIQVPNVASSSFQQTAALKSGDTLVLTGFKQTGAQDARNGVGTPSFYGLGGGVDATTNRTMLAIVITARIL